MRFSAGFDFARAHRTRFQHARFAQLSPACTASGARYRRRDYTVGFLLAADCRPHGFLRGCLHAGRRFALARQATFSMLDGRYFTRAPYAHAE